MTGNSHMSPRRNLWPLGIIAAFAVFLTGTAGLIVMACRNSNDLVSVNYYDDEVRFQNRIDQRERTHRLPAPVLVSYNPASRRIIISIPPTIAGATVKGRVDLYRPSAARFDRSYEFNPDATGQQCLDSSSLVPGLWVVKILWTANGQDYCHEQKVVVGGGAL